MNYKVNNTVLVQDIPEMGVNVLRGKKFAARDANGIEFMPSWEKPIDFITHPNVYMHIDFMAQLPITLSFDMEEKIDFESVLVGSTISYAYGLMKYEVYCSNDVSDLYDIKNRIAEYDNTGVGDGISYKEAQPVPGTVVKFDFEKAVSGRYFGIKVLKANRTDDIARIARIAVYSKAHDAQVSYLEKFGKTVIKDLHIEFVNDYGKSPCIWPDYGKNSFLNDGIAFNKNKTVKYSFSKCFNTVIRLDEKVASNRFVITSGKTLPKMKFYASDSAKTLYDNELEVTESIENSFGETIHIFDFKPVESKFFAARFIGEGKKIEMEISEMMLCCPSRCVTADANDVVNKDFVGNGANILPYSMQPGNMELGYNDELFAVDSNRVFKTKTALIRFWLQIDWFEKEKGVYDFNTPEMQGVYRYFDLFKASGTEVQLTFSWKIGPVAQPWMSIPTVSQPVNSAPADIEHYAKSYSLLMQELFRRGYNNVFHISFANEPGFSWDFLVDPHDNCKDYYCKVVRAVDKQFREDGLRDKTIFWACESAESMDWIEYCKDHIDDCVDYYTFHCYESTVENLKNVIFKHVREIGAQPFLITECAEGGSIQANAWGRSLAGYIITSANEGGSGCVMWTLTGITSMSPMSSKSWEMDTDVVMWHSQLKGGLPGMSYYNMGMFTRYIPAHSKTVKTSVIGDDILSATFITPDGDVTVLVELAKSKSARELTLNIPNIGRKYHKHVYNPSKIDRNFNAVLPRAVSDFDGGKIVDTDIPNDYSVLVYTTMDSQTQVAINAETNKISVGESLKLSAEVIDGSGPVVWDVMNGKGSITADGVYTAENVTSGDTVAVTATCKNSPDGQGIIIIYIK